MQSYAGGYKPAQNYNGGNITFAAPAVTSIAVTTTEAVAFNVDRKYLIITNDSDEVMYLGFDSPAVMNKGFRLNSAGGTIEWIGPHIFPCAINAICASGTKNLTYIEGS
jgi:hypothetical protein